MDIKEIASFLEKYIVPDFVPYDTREDIETKLYDIVESLQSITRKIANCERQSEAVQTHGGFDDIREFDKWQNGILNDMPNKFPFLNGAENG